MKKTLVSSILIILLAFCSINCDNENSGSGKFTVTFDLDGGNISGNTSSVKIIVNSSDTISNLPNPIKEDYDFDGWFTLKNGGGIQFTTSTVISENKTVYANWIENNNQISGKYYLQDNYQLEHFYIEFIDDAISFYTYDNEADMTGIYVISGNKITSTYMGYGRVPEGEEPELTEQYFYFMIINSNTIQCQGGQIWNKVKQTPNIHVAAIQGYWFLETDNNRYWNFSGNWWEYRDQNEDEYLSWFFTIDENTIYLKTEYWEEGEDMRTILPFMEFNYQLTNDTLVLEDNGSGFHGTFIFGEVDDFEE